METYPDSSLKLERAIRASIKTTFALALFLACIPQTAQGQTENDGGAWFSINTQGILLSDSPRKSNLRWWFDGHLRYLDDSGGYHQSIIRPALGYALSADATLWMGYAYINELPVSGADVFSENRIWEQLTWNFHCDHATLFTRSRLEQRFVETGDDTGWRFRQFVKVDRPIFEDARLSVVVWDEAFFDLNRTDWGQQDRFSQNRAFVGFGWQFDGRGQPKIEIGYLNQFLSRRSRDDRFNHIASLNWFLTY